MTDLACKFDVKILSAPPVVRGLLQAVGPVSVAHKGDSFQRENKVGITQGLREEIREFNIKI
jgi:hypothetical protein